MLARLLNIFAVRAGNSALKQVNTDLKHIQQHAMNVSETLVTLRAENHKLRTENDELRTELAHVYKYNEHLSATNRSLVNEGALLRAQIRNLDRWIRNCKS
jgi:predicted nuclease with TOPRIM domain